MKKMINTERIEGRVYDHDLVIKQVQNRESANYGKEFISGNLHVAVDEEGLNVIPVHFTYVTEENKNGQKNITYTILKRIIEENKTWLTEGKENALKVRVNTALALNDFYNQNNELVSAPMNEGGFVSTISGDLASIEERNRWDTDMLITSVRRIEADEEKNIKEDCVKVKGAIFNFRNEILPMEFTVRNPEGMDYFEGLEVSNTNPEFKKVWGEINCLTVTTQVTEESAFGEPAVKTYSKKTKEWTLTGAKGESYDFGNPDVLTAEEVQKAMADREVMLADVKKRRDEYMAQKNGGNTQLAAATTAQPTTPAQSGTFNF